MVGQHVGALARFCELEHAIVDELTVLDQARYGVTLPDRSTLRPRTDLLEDFALRRWAPNFPSAVEASCLPPANANKSVGSSPVLGMPIRRFGGGIEWAYAALVERPQGFGIQEAAANQDWQA